MFCTGKHASGRLSVLETLEDTANPLYHEARGPLAIVPSRSLTAFHLPMSTLT